MMEPPPPFPVSGASSGAEITALFGEALQEHQAGRLVAAEALYRRVLAAAPRHAESLHRLGVLASQGGRHALAETLIEAALAVRGHEPAYWSNLGNVVMAQGRPGEAVDRYQQALRLRPAYPEALLNLGLALQACGRLEAAIGCFEQVLALVPAHPLALDRLAGALLAGGRLGAAAECYRQLQALLPERPEPPCNLGGILHRLGRLSEAEGCYRQALSLCPGHPEALNNLGTLLLAQDQPAAACACYARSLEGRPGDPDTLGNLGNALTSQGRIEEALACYEAALRGRPAAPGLLGNRLLALTYLDHLSAWELAAAHREAGAAMAAGPLPPAPPPRRFSAGERLRIGYVSPDFRRHAVAFFFEPLLRAHDRHRVEIMCYAEGAVEDAVTARLRALSDRWVPTLGLSDAALAERIRADGIDVLIDLAGHTAHNRLPVFALRPAPVQASWLGYPNTTGLAAIGYRLVDAVTDPPGVAEPLAVETLIRLGGGFLCYQPPAAAPEPLPAPCLAGAPVTFGSFNNPAKLSPATLDTWCRLLARLPTSRLLLKAAVLGEEATRALILSRLTERGVAPGRVILAGAIADDAGHLAAYGRIDIALDPFPYNGTATTCEALWMGVPVVTLAGDRHAGRVGASLLTRVGLPELIARDREDYLEIAAALAADPVRLGALRAGLRQRLAASPLCDEAGFARRFEHACETLAAEHNQ